MEKDDDLAILLKEKFENEIEIINNDILKVDDGRQLRLVGNLPYNISTPLLFHLLTIGHLIKDMHFMLQREVVDRLGASPGNKTYGRLSVMIQIKC